MGNVGRAIYFILSQLCDMPCEFLQLKQHTLVLLQWSIRLSGSLNGTVAIVFVRNFQGPKFIFRLDFISENKMKAPKPSNAIPIRYFWLACVSYPYGRSVYLKNWCVIKTQFFKRNIPTFLGSFCPETLRNNKS